MYNLSEIFLIEEHLAQIALFLECLKILHSKAKVITAGSGSQVREFLNKFHNRFHNTPDLIISEMHVPGYNAYDFLTLLKDYKPLAKIPFVVFTNTDLPIEIVKCYENGATAILTKPNDLFPLVKKVGQILEIVNSDKRAAF